MGRFKQMEIERQEAEQAIDFDERNYTDGAWWSLQDAEMHEAEQRDRMEALEIEAEIFELRSLGMI